jgi:hypothetical protein
MTFMSLLKSPSAIIPLVMSLAAFMVVVVVLVTVGINPSEDEGTAAHIFQLLIALQVPIVAYFAFKWLPQNPRPASFVLLMQVAAAMLAVGTIAWIESAVAL